MNYKQEMEFSQWKARKISEISQVKCLGPQKGTLGTEILSCQWPLFFFFFVCTLIGMVLQTLYLFVMS